MGSSLDLKDAGAQEAARKLIATWEDGEVLKGNYAKSLETIWRC